MDPLALERQGLALKAAGRFAEAAAAFMQQTRLQPKSHGAYYNLGNTYLAAAQLEQAVDAYRRAVRLAPRFAPAHNNLGLALLQLGKMELAAASFARAVALEPGSAAAQHLAGHALLQAKRPEEALPYLHEANRLAPHQAAIVTDLADALRRTGDLFGCLPWAQEAAALAPERIEAWTNLANAARDTGALALSEEASRRALAIDPEHGEAHFNMALTLLLDGRMAEAWPHWEHRWRGVAGARARFEDRAWDGAALPEGTLFLHNEQGMGDTIQFCRYVTWAAARGRVVLAVQKPLLRLMQSLAGPAAVIADTDTPPDFTAQAPLMSLPMIFGTDTGNIPTGIPYLAADPARVAFWAARLAALPGRRVGLVWAGNRDFPFDHARSIPPAMLNPLAGTPGVSFVNLQVGAGPKPDLPLSAWTAELVDFAETAALIAALDLVISVDTAVVHLAGALGRPVWLLNRFAGDWRWGREGHRSAWYPTLLQFRQARPGAWPETIVQVRKALETG